MKFLKFNKCGMYVQFAVDDESRLLILSILDREEEIKFDVRHCFTALEMHITGSNPDDHHGAKHTGGSSPDDLKYISFTESDNDIVFTLSSSKIKAYLHYEFFENSKTVRAYSDIINISNENVGIEYVSSFALFGFKMDSVIIPHNAWCREFELREYTPEQLGLNRINDCSFKRIAAANTGTWSTKEYLPMGCIKSEDKTILWQIEHNGSWNWEISDIANELYLKLSGPSEQENAWWKDLKPNETFTTVKATVSIVSGGFNEAVAELTKYRRNIAYRSPADKKLPVIFNDYMGCLWADPTTEKELPLIDVAASVGAEVYCMDAGWYAEGNWWDTVGDWEVWEKRFPNGMKEVFDHIHSKGMIAGIWLEPESMGIKCPIVDKFDDDCFFMRHGKRVIDHGRYQLDFRNKKVIDHLNKVVDRLINDFGIGYFKFDYNIDASLGTECYADSFGDGLMQHNEAYLNWIDSLYQRYPNLMIESCASGGMRMDYKTLSHFTIQSLTDASEYTHLAQIASLSSFAVIPEQSAVWCVPKASHSISEIECGMASSMFRRIHLSGEVMALNEEQLEAVKNAVEFYKQTRDEITSLVPVFPLGITNFEDDIKCSGYKNEENLYICIENLSDEKKEIKIPAEKGYNNAVLIYPTNNDSKYTLCDTLVKVDINPKSAMILKLD